MATTVRPGAATRKTSKAGAPPLRVTFQRRAARAYHRHFLRSLMRVSALVIGDTVASLLGATIVRLARDSAFFGGSFASWAEWVFPEGILGGFQFTFALVLGLGLVRAYGPGDRRRDVRRILLGVSLAAGLTLWSDVWDSGLRVVASFLATVTGTFILVSLLRWVIDFAVKRYWLPIRPAEHVLFIGDPDDPDALRICGHLSHGERIEVAGWLQPGASSGSMGTTSQTVEDLWRTLQEVRVDTVVLCGAVPSSLFDKMVDACAVAGCRLLTPSRYDGVRPVRPSLVWYHRLPFVELTIPSLRGRQLFLKRFIDVSVSAVALGLLAPLMVAIAATVRLETGGRVLFRQERLGRGGRRFQMLKFRTMYEGVSDHIHRQHVWKQLTADSSSDDEATYKLVGDARITRVGAFLRRTSLDELPQLINVLRGEMSLVGPRPPLPYEVDAYEAWQFERLMVQPGITGLWQVSGRSALSYRQMCKLDAQYVQSWSIWLDLRILAKTIPVVLLNSGRAA